MCVCVCVCVASCEAAVWGRFVYLFLGHALDAFPVNQKHTQFVEAMRDLCFSTSLAKNMPGPYFNATF